MPSICDLMWPSIGLFQRVHNRKVTGLTPPPPQVLLVVFSPQLGKRILFFIKQRQTILLQFSKFTEGTPLVHVVVYFVGFVCFILSILKLDLCIYLVFPIFVRIENSSVFKEKSHAKQNSTFQRNMNGNDFPNIYNF